MIFTLVDKPPLVLYLETLDPHIRVLLGLQSFIPSFVYEIQEDKKVVYFSHGICRKHLPNTVVVFQTWLETAQITLMHKVDMQQALHPLPNQPRMPQTTQM